MKRILGLILIVSLSSCGEDANPEAPVIDFETTVAYGISTSTDEGVDISFHLFDYANEVTETIIENYQGNKNLFSWVGHKLYYEQDQAIQVFDIKERTLTEVLKLDNMIIGFKISPNEVYASFTIYGTGDRMIVDLTSGNQVALFDTSYSRPIWSKNDQSIAIIKQAEDETTELYTYDIETEEMALVESGEQH